MKFKELYTYMCALVFMMSMFHIHLSLASYIPAPSYDFDSKALIDELINEFRNSVAVSAKTGNLEKIHETKKVFEILAVLSDNENSVLKKCNQEYTEWLTIVKSKLENKN